MAKYRVVIGDDIVPYPEKFEISAAVILSRHFKTDVKFISKKSVSTPDVVINNIFWEIKSPTGSGKRTIQHQIHNALSQSKNIVFDARRTKLRIDKIRTDLARHAVENKSIKRLILIEKDEKVVIIK